MAVSWREKYLQALSDQESTEKRSLAQIQQLRTCLQALAGVALGADPELDELLLSLAQPAKVKPSRVINSEHITKAAHKVTERRATRVAVSHDSLLALVDDLLDLNPSGDIKKELKKYKRGLKRRAEHQHAYPQLLREIADLQAQVIDDIVAKRPGWFARVMGDKARLKQDQQKADNGQDDSTQTLGEGEQQQYENIRQNEQQNDEIIEADFLVLDDEPITEGTLETKVEIAAQDYIDGGVVEPTPIKKPENKEPAFTSISDKISQILQEMLDGVAIEECVKQKYVDAKSRIDAGLNWYEMVATLEDIRDLVLQAYLISNENFTRYLEDVEQALEQIKDQWLRLIENKKHQINGQEQVKNQLGSYKQKLLVNVETASELTELKSSVAGHIEDLASTITLVEAIEQENRQYNEEFMMLQDRFTDLQNNYVVLQQELAKQKHKALHDALTGLPNRDAYNQKIHDELIRWRRYKRPLCVAVVDVDHFKRFNDTFGHQTGDRVLKIIGKILRQRLREVDFIARFGGEEFVIILPETSTEAAKEVLDSIRKSLAKAPFKFKDEPVSITASFGLTEFAEQDSSETAFARADQALYQAKSQGRNQVSVSKE